MAGSNNFTAEPFEHFRKLTDYAQSSETSWFTNWLNIDDVHVKLGKQLEDNQKFLGVKYPPDDHLPTCDYHFGTVGCGKNLHQILQFSKQRDMCSWLRRSVCMHQCSTMHHSVHTLNLYKIIMRRKEIFYVER